MVKELINDLRWMAFIGLLFFVIGLIFQAVFAVFLGVSLMIVGFSLFGYTEKAYAREKELLDKE